jgi:pimeloyl-ACP methyl ester carboxylesterase
MRGLGYARWFAQGGDWGSAVTTAIALQKVEDAPASTSTCRSRGRCPRTLQRLARRSPRADRAPALSGLGFGLFEAAADPPADGGIRPGRFARGLAGWIYEKMWAWTDNAGRAEDALDRDAILDNIMLYWLPAAGASSARLYWESFGSFAAKDIDLPVAVSAFPKEILPTPRKWAERHYRKLVHWGDMEKGGHFAAWEQPEAFVRELRIAFGKMR